MIWMSFDVNCPHRLVIWITAVFWHLAWLALLWGWALRLITISCFWPALSASWPTQSMRRGNSKLLSLRSQLLLHAFSPGWTIFSRTRHQRSSPLYVTYDWILLIWPFPFCPSATLCSANMVPTRGRAPEAVWSWVFSLQNHKLDDCLSFTIFWPRLLCYSSRKLHYDFQKSFRAKSLLFGVALGQWQAIALGRSSLFRHWGRLSSLFYIQSHSWTMQHSTFFT